MARLKRIRHERFALEYIAAAGNAAVAYRKVSKLYPLKPNLRPDSYKVIGYQILRRPEVTQRVRELRHQMAVKADITMTKILTDYQEALELAKRQARAGDIVNAATAQAKLVGLLRDRVETGAAGDFDGLDNPSEILDKLAQEAGPEAALAFAQAYGLEPPKEEQKNAADDLLDQPAASESVN